MNWLLSTYLAAPSSSEPSKHLPHALLPMLKVGHGVPAIAASLVIVLLVTYAFFKLMHFRSA